MQVVDYADLEDDVGEGKNLKDMVLTKLWDHADQEWIQAFEFKQNSLVFYGLCMQKQTIFPAIICAFLALDFC